MRAPGQGLRPAVVVSLLALSYGLAACGASGESLPGDGGHQSDALVQQDLLVQYDLGQNDTAPVQRDAGGGSDATVVNCGADRQPCCNGTACNAGLTCVSGTCSGTAPCGKETQPCCSGNACGTDLVCQSGTCVKPPSCGKLNEACCTGNMCVSGLVCQSNVCKPPATCGGARQPCCASNACASGLVCTGGTCDTAPVCGGAHEACCNGTACNAGLTCTGGTCQTTAGTCGAIGQACCTTGTACTNGTCCSSSCVNTATDPRNCGGCGNPCAGTCSGGTCQTPTCGGDGQACCTTGQPCRTGLECQSGTCHAPATSCTEAAQSCTAVGECCAGLSCRASPTSSLCCVEAAGACTSSADCCGWMLCSGGFCSCRTGSQSCVTNADCCAGLACQGGACVTAADPCSSDTTCDDCTANSSCGWCASSSTCLTGSLSGPSAATCADWRWYQSSCSGTPVDPCASSPACDACTTTPDCGWCETDFSCRTGTLAGPSGGSCSQWVWLATQCVDPCTDFTTCYDCDQFVGCGWCETSGTCMSGDEYGPTSGSCYDWRYEGALCTDPCVDYYTCAECDANAACGWCESTWTCQAGNSTGPTYGTCGDWIFYVSYCPAPDPCLSSLTCDDCTTQGNCGWCESTWECLSGDTTGPNSGVCYDWRWYNSECY